ncbi:MAG: hypothetical protein H0U76_09385 [Ktedonobacteraceae bacterium]|nr:hypothetical protein [Ktedonobacteraceae bacterium]
MKHFYLRVQARSPLAIRSDQSEGGAKTAQYISGVTLLGSLAAAHRMLHESQETAFADFFLQDKVYFPHLYPALFSKSKSHIHGVNTPVVPLPRTAQTCKRFAGFLPLAGEEDAEKRHGIRDSLFDWGAFSLLEQSEKVPSIETLVSPFHAHKDCGYTTLVDNQEVCCGQVMDHAGASGYYRSARLNMQQRMMAQVHTRLQTHSGINREWGVVEEGILYNREVFDENMLFWGELLLADDLADAFQQFVQEANEEDMIRIGTGRTRGLGRINLEMIDEEQPADIRSREIALFTERLTRFDGTFRKQAQNTGVNAFDHFYFAVTLRSGSILCDPYLRYFRTLSAKLLEQELEWPAGSCKPIYQSTDIQRISGWNELWGTPRAHDYALEMGSTFLFAYTQKPDSAFFNALRTLEERGIGRRRAEGFGRVSISDPFHLEGEQA